MASAQIFTDGNFQGVGTDGLVVPNGKLYIYDNATGLLATTYQDSAQTITNTNPVILSASGKAKVFLSAGTYDITLKTSADVTVWTLNDYIADDVYSKAESDAILSARTVGTIAALRTTVYSGQSFVSVTGYYTALDNIGVREYHWDTTSTESDNSGTIIQVTGVVTGRWKMKYSGAVNVKWFGAKGDGITDDTVAIQNAVNVAISNPTKLLKINFDPLTYIITDDIVINVRDTSVNANYAQLEIEGVGGYALSNSQAGTVIKCTTANKNIFRVCMEASGAYPGGGAGIVTLPLQYLRRLHVSNITFQGDFGTSPTVNAIAGRGIFQSLFFNCGFNGAKYATLFGKAEATSQELSADGFELDYCERIKFDSCGFSNNITHIHALAADAFEATNCTFNKVIGVGGRHAYFAGCNDTITYRKCLIQPETTTSTANTTNFVLRDVRGIAFDECHFEQIRGNLISTPTAIEVISITKSLLYSGSALSTSVISATIKNYGKIYLNKNNVVYPSSSANYMQISAIDLTTIHADYQDNRSVTTLGGTTPIAITTNLQGSNLNFGRYGDPLFIGEKVYLWATSTGKLMFSTTKPTSDTNGTFVGEDAYLSGTVSFPGVTVNAGSYASINLAITGANYSRFIFLSPDVTVGEMVWNANNIGGSTVKVTFHNPTAGNITIASGTWKYKIELN